MGENKDLKDASMQEGLFENKKIINNPFEGGEDRSQGDEDDSEGESSNEEGTGANHPLLPEVYIYPVMASEPCDPLLLDLLLKHLTSSGGPSSSAFDSSESRKVHCFLAIYESGEINLFAVSPGIVLQ